MVTITDYQYREAGTPHWFPSRAGPKSEIYADLLNNGAIPDPFLDDNEDKVQWVAEKNWEYRASFQVSESDLKHEHLQLHCEGLDTFCTVYVNDNKVGETDNMFAEHVVDVNRDILVVGENWLLLHFDLALFKGRQLEADSFKGVFWNGESSRLHVRKTQYHWGWDWGPRLILCGPYRPVHFLAYDDLVNDIYCQVKLEDKGKKAVVDVTVDITGGNNWALKISDPEGNTVVETLVSETTYSATIDDPQLWWPYALGGQPLYTVTVTSGSASKSTTIGLRTVELVQEPIPGEPGTSFYFKVNDTPIYVNGSNWIPGHSFVTMMTDNDFQKWIDIMVQGNQNVIRVWAGGNYEENVFFEECDKRGLLVWQDFQFACGQYPAHEKFVASVEMEAKSVLKRIRNHPSLLVFAGNNEDYQIAEQEHLEWDPKDHSGDYTRTTFPARKIYEQVLPEIMKSYLPAVPYHPGSPWGGEKPTPDRTVGDIHQWNVWHGSQEPYQDWYRLGGRFVLEFGMEALPNIQTYKDCITDAAQIYPQLRMVDHHNKADGFERRLALYVMENVKVTKLDMQSWIYATQLMQAECLAYAYRCWRRDWGRGDEVKRLSGGAIVWQINDCWPVALWAIVDFYKRPKLAYYAVKRELAPINVGAFRNNVDGIINCELWGVNLTLDDVDATIKIQFYEVSGEPVASFDQQVKLCANQSTEFCSHVLLSPDTTVVHARLLINGEEVASAGDWPQPLKYLTFKDVKVEATVDGDLIIVSTNKPVKGVELVVGDGIFLSDNGFDLFPGQSKLVNAPGLNGGSVEVNWYQK